MFGFFRAYIAGFSEIAKPLSDLISQRVPNVLPWVEREQKAFDTLKERLCNITELAIPKVGHPFILHTDANGTSIGHVCHKSTTKGMSSQLPI